MNRTITFCITSVISLLLYFKTTAQVKIGDNPGTIKTASLLELESTNKGLVMPRVSLNGTINSPSPLGADILAGTIVYNTNAAFIGGTGLQIWTGSAWMVITPSSLNSNDAWKLTGNSGTNPATNFVGTTDAQPLKFKVNGQKAGEIGYSSAAGLTSFGYQSLNANTSGFRNTAIGYQALYNNTSGNDNTANGFHALYNTTSGNNNTANGVEALFNNTIGTNNTANGFRALNANISGNNNTGIGIGSLFSNITGTNNTATGNLALYFNTTGLNNAAYGYQSLYSNTTGLNNVAIGLSLYSNTSGNDNNAYGLHSLNLNTTGNGNVAYGDSTLFSNITGSFNTAIGHYADVAVNNLRNATAIGYKAKVAVSNALVLGNTTDNIKVGIGTSSPLAQLEIRKDGNTGPSLLLSNNAGGAGSVASLQFTTYNPTPAVSNPTATITASDDNYSSALSFSTKIPGNSANALQERMRINGNGSLVFPALTNGLLVADGSGNVSTTSIATATANTWSLNGNSGTDPSTNFIGTADAQPLIFKVNNGKAGRLDYLSTAANTSFGYQSLNTLTNGINNTSIGYFSLAANTTGNNNTANGYIALLSNSTGSSNVASGNGTLRENTTGNNNTGYGSQALVRNTIGDNNTGYGWQALLTNTTGTNNTAVGSGADVGSANLTNATAIGANANVAISNAMVLGSVGINVGIGTSSPTANLHVNGSVRFEDLTNGVLTTDANGNLSTTNLSANSWSLSGNSGTNPSTNFIGTADAQPLIFKVNNGKAGRLDYLNTAANTAFGYQSLNANTSGVQNVAVGYQALYSNNTYNNTAVGTQALYSNTSGNSNVGNGYQAMYKNTTGNSNAVNGDQALYNNTIGNNNTANGFQALYSNTTGGKNTANGSEALYTNTTGNDNTANGVKALYKNNTGGNNTATGETALYSNTSGNDNNAYGLNSMFSNTTGSFNAAYGDSALFNNTSGNNNTAYGNKSLEFNMFGNLNTAIGYNADVFYNGLTNATAIGANANVSVSNAVVLGNNAAVGIGTSSPGINAKVEIVGVGAGSANMSYRYMNSSMEGNTTSSNTYSLYTSGRIWCAGEINVTSDMRTKTNIVTSGSSKNLSLINKLRVVNYNYKDNVAKGTANITGFLAQEVEQVMPDAITKNKGIVPDIYQNAIAVKYDEAAKALTLTLKETAAVKAGDTLKFITDAGEQLAAIASVNGNTITVSNWASNSKWVFVYGKQINDLRNLDYNKIFSAGIGAIQELSKENESLKSDVETLKAQMKILMDKMNTTAKAN